MKNVIQFNFDDDQLIEQTNQNFSPLQLTV